MERFDFLAPVHRQVQIAPRTFDDHRHFMGIGAVEAPMLALGDALDPVERIGEFVFQRLG